jgi:alanine racemase
LLLEGFFATGELPEIAARRIAVVVHNMEQIRMLGAAKLERPLEVFLKINTGMNRLGIRPAEVTAAVESLTQCDAVATVRLMTHLARAEERDGVLEQLAVSMRFATARRIHDRLPTRGIVRYGTVGGDIVRPGMCSRRDLVSGDSKSIRSSRSRR